MDPATMSLLISVALQALKQASEQLADENVKRVLEEADDVRLLHQAELNARKILRERGVVFE